MTKVLRDVSEERKVGKKRAIKAVEGRGKRKKTNKKPNNSL